MIFFSLALVALVFALLGFLTHAFYFDRKDRIGNLEKEIESLTRMLARRDQAKTEAEQQTAAAKGQIQVLEQRLTQGNEKIRALQTTVQQLGNEIRKLQDAASEIPAAIAQPVELKPAVRGMDTPVTTPITSNGEKIPLWKDNLNNILETLNKIEKEEKE